MSDMNTFLLFIVVLGPLIFFHELGHFIVARLFGVGVERFSLGFGPRLFGRTVGRTDYRVSLIPLGGYVKMVGDEPDADLPPEDLPYSFTHKPVLQRSLIVTAGPVANALLAFLIFVCMIYFVGITSIRPYVRKVEAGSAAEQAGVRLDDRLLAIDDRPVTSWRDINAILDANQAAPVRIAIDRQGERLDLVVKPKSATYTNLYNEEVTYYDLGIAGVADPAAVVGTAVEGMPAAMAGLRSGDRIVAIDGRPITYWREMQEIVTGSEGRAMQFSIGRGDERLDIEITPVMDKGRNLAGIRTENFRIGITRPDLVPPEDKIVLKVGFLQSMEQSAALIWKVAGSFFDFLGKLFQGKVSRELVGGPIRIAQMAQQSAQMGMMELFSFVAAISLQLAVLNLLPIPVLDGGHLLFYGIEAAMRKPVNRRMRETAQQVGLFLLLLLMVFVVYNDIDLTWIK